MRIFLAAAALIVAVATSAHAADCYKICANTCAQKELAPGLYRMECEDHCVPNCLWKHETDAAGKNGAKKQKPKAR